MIPLYLLLENFMSHGRSELDFTQFDKALIVGVENDDPDSSNGIGKTAIFDAIRWAIYGKCRFRTKRRIIKRGKILSTVTFIFQFQNETYKIVRKMSQRATTAEVSFYIKDEQDWIDLSCDTSTLTNDKIEDLIKLSHDTFVSSIYFQQNELLQFAAATANEKKEILKGSLHIEMWDKYQEKAKDMVRRLSAQSAALDDRIKLFGNIDGEIGTNKSSMESLQKKITKTQDKIINITKQIEEAKEKNVDLSSEQYSRIVVRLGQITHRKQMIVKDLDNYKELINKTQTRKSELEEDILENARHILVVSGHKERMMAEEIFKKSSHNLPSYTVFYSRLDQDVENLKEQRKRLNHISVELDQLLALEPGKKCPTCLSIIDNLEDIIEQRKKYIKTLEMSKEQLYKSISELAKSVSYQHEIISRADSAVISLNNIRYSLLQIDAQKEELESWCANLEQELVELKEEWILLNLEKSKLKISDDPEFWGKKIKDLSVELEKLHKELLEMSVEYGNLQGHSEDLTRRLSERATLIAQKPIINKELDVHNQLVKAFGKGGVPAIIMENITEDLRNYANEILKLISDKPMTVDFVTQRRTEAGSWSETFDLSVSIDDEINEFDDLSGGEQVRVAMATRLALSGVLMRRMGTSAKFLLLDEVDQALDKRGVQALADALDNLSKEFKILVITHNDNMKERFDHIITVQKTLEGSFIRQ